MSSRITVPQPCPASWADMTPAPGGRHCAACNKVVMDFTQLSEAELLAVLGHSGFVCGRFRTEQLAFSGGLRTARGNWAGWLTAAAVALSGCEAPDPAQVRLRPAPVTADASAFVVRGQVVDKNSGKPLAGARITSHADSTLHTRADATGRFELKLPPQLRDSALFVAYHGPDDTEYISRRERPAANMLVRLREHPGTMGLFAYETGETGETEFGELPPPPKLSTITFTPTTTQTEEKPE